MTAGRIRVRISKLQESQLDAVVAIDAACRPAMHRAGVPAAETPARAAADIAKLTRGHDVLVAEADGVVAGYAVWRDESPGVAYLEDIVVKEELQRHGVGRKLIEAVVEGAGKVSLPILVTRFWTRAPGARAFLEKVGFAPFGKDAGERAALWREEQEAGGQGFAKEGQAVLWRSLL